MNALAWLYRSTIGKKIIMATTGLVLVGWLIAHLLGNLQIFLPPEWMDGYAEHLHNLGPLLWALRLGMLGTIVLHIWSAVQVIRISRAARSTAYTGGFQRSASTVGSRMMRLGGVFILGFLVFHLLDLTVGIVHPDFLVQEHGAAAAYHNLVTSLRRPVVAVVYMLGATFVGLHVSHGIQSAFQTLGGNHPKWNQLRLTSSVAVGLILALGNIAIVVAVLTGLVGGN